MPANYVLLEKITVGAAGASSVTFSDIPQTGYTDLVVKVSARDNYSAAWRDLGISFNGLTTNRTGILLYGNPTTAASYSVTTGNVAFSNSNTSTASTFGNVEYCIPNYTSANYKSFSVDSVTENNSTDALANLSAGLWSSTAAITSVTLTPLGGSFDQYSTAYLYGVAALGTTPAIAPYATGGDTIMTDGTYWYHTFVSSGTFTPQKEITCDYLVVAGGGGGNVDSSGGGGAGGLRSTVTATGGGGSLESALVLDLDTPYTVTVGAGGAYATNGSDSVFPTITSTGGGRGGGNAGTSPSYVGASGGSGGGGGGGGTPYGGGTGTANQGFDGGAGNINPPNYPGGGGGGAGATGVTPASGSANGGAGGNGVATSISGSSVSYGGGGGGNGGVGTGGAGGTGGGGTGSDGPTGGTNGTANTGGGAGGGSAANQKIGGSGIVIVRYAV
jgi:hypothetical protein